MAVTYGFYNSLSGDRKYNTAQISQMFDGIIKDGIFMSIGDHLTVSAAGGMILNVGTGKAWFNHTWTLNDAILPITIDASETILDRIDAIVLEVDSTETVRANSIKFVKGTPSSSPVQPTLANTDTVHQYPLCYISTKAGVTEITQAVVENRIGMDECPYITGLMDVNSIQNLVAQWGSQFSTWTEQEKTYFDDWFATVQDVLDGDVAGNLLNQINAHKENKGIHVAVATHSKDGTVHNLALTELTDRNLTFLATADFFSGDTFAVNGNPVDSELQNGELLSDKLFKTGCWVTGVRLSDDGTQLTFPSGGGSTAHNTSDGILVISVTRYDGGEIGTTKVRVQNTALGMDLSYTPDALGKVTLHLVGNKTYSISLVNVPDPYYGEAATQYVGFDTENELALQVKDQPDIIGFQVNLSTGAVDYTDGAADWTPMSMNGSTLEPGSFENSWLVKDVRPCLLKNGVVQYYLKKLDGFMMFDYDHKENGDSSDTTTGNDGDVMIEIPKVYMQSTIETVLNVKYLHVRFTKQSLSGYTAATIFGSPARDSIYYAAYKPWMASQSSSAVSISGQTPVKYATTQGVLAPAELLSKIQKYSGITDINNRDILFLYELYIMLFKTHNLTAYGYSAVTSSTYAHNTGAYNNHPLCYMAVNRFRFLGIEDPFSQIVSVSTGLMSTRSGYARYAPSCDFGGAINISDVFNTINQYDATLRYLSLSFTPSPNGLFNPSSLQSGSSLIDDGKLYLEVFPGGMYINDSRCDSLLMVDVHGSNTKRLTFDAKSCYYLRQVYTSTHSPGPKEGYNFMAYLTFKFLEPVS